MAWGENKESMTILSASIAWDLTIEPARAESCIFVGSGLRSSGRGHRPRLCRCGRLTHIMQFPSNLRKMAIAINLDF